MKQKQPANSILYVFFFASWLINQPPSPSEIPRREKYPHPPVHIGVTCLAKWQARSGEFQNLIVENWKVQRQTEDEWDGSAASRSWQCRTRPGTPSGRSPQWLQRACKTNAVRIQSLQTNLLSQVTRLVRGILNFIVEDGKVQRQAEPDRVSGLHFAFANFKRVLVGLLRVLYHTCRPNGSEKEMDNRDKAEEK